MPSSLRRTFAGLGVACVLTLTVGAQTKIVAPKNNYSVQDDVKLGREAAAEVAKELPMLNDQRLENYVETVGNDTCGTCHRSSFCIACHERNR